MPYAQIEQLRGAQDRVGGIAASLTQLAESMPFAATEALLAIVDAAHGLEDAAKHLEDAILALDPPPDRGPGQAPPGAPGA